MDHILFWNVGEWDNFLVCRLNSDFQETRLQIPLRKLLSCSKFKPLHNAETLRKPRQHSPQASAQPLMRIE